MSIRVRFFASLAESVGRREVECPFVPGMTVESVWRDVNGDTPLPVGALVAINHDYCTLDQALNDQDEVAYFPPVTGG
ncbi:MAG: MoaD/ThiS family protein [Proteobacteria bacterium]|nr:MoaD/ThiS family protein [Pseudomonadota bacterium]MBK8960854.1 MoaD/ThiS family protein [Pseudomonadota bacterium]